jgi:hypothetical protein
MSGRNEFVGVAPTLRVLRTNDTTPKAHQRVSQELQVRAAK